jgi:pimeloyl-ACP methyl ester carboxylesterase
VPERDRGDGVRLSYVLTAGTGPIVVFLPGFMSDMTGDKARAVAGFCQARGTACLRLDYAGHGASGGRFEDGTIGSWTSDALCLIDALTEGPILVIGSSMGGWIGLKLALARPARVVGLIGIAAAPDFTETLMWESMAPSERATLMRDGRLRVPSPDRGRPRPSAVACAHCRDLSGAAVAGHAGPRRAVGDRVDAGRAAARR